MMAFPDTVSMAAEPTQTVRELLAISYANLAMAHAAYTARAERYGRIHFMIRAKLKKGLLNDSMSMRPLAEDEKLKMILPRACSYCGGEQSLSADHLIPSSRGGLNTGDNLVWACRSCNSSKGARDFLEWWFTKKEGFPPLLLLRRYLKTAWELARTAELLETSLDGCAALPLAFGRVPTKYPPPKELRLWIVPLPGD